MTDTDLRETGDPSDERAVSSVADVSLALVLVLASIAVFVAFLDTGGDEHDPAAAAHTAETLGAATLDVSYSLEPVLETDSDHVAAVGDSDAPYSSADLERSTHGTSMGHVARAAVAGAGFDLDGGETLPLAVGDGYTETLEERLVASLVGSQFAANVTAVWEPFEGSSVRGTARVGEPVPRDTERSVVRTTVPSELPAVRADAVAAVEKGGGYGAVAEHVADALVDGGLGDTQRALETDGVERAVTVSRYLRFADAVGVTLDPEALTRAGADPAAMNETLADELAAQFEASLETSFETPEEAARAVSVGTVAISVTTWT